MKRIFAAFATAVALSASAQTNAPVDNFTLVTNLWYQGYKTNVLQIAEQRLAANSNDLAGLVLKMEYDFEFVNAQSISNDMLAVLSASMSQTNGVFSAHKEEVLEELGFFLLFLEKDYRPTASEIEDDRAKARFIHSRMSFERYLKWLRDAGLF